MTDKEREEAIQGLKNLANQFRGYEPNEKMFDLAIKALESQGWIPIKTRPLTEEEKEHYISIGWSDDSIEFMYDCQLPDDGQEVLVTDRMGNVGLDTFFSDDGCYFENNCDAYDVIAWMPLPKPYKESEGER